MFKKHTLPSFAGIAFTLLLLANSSARADLISWGYNWEASTPKISANGGGSGYLTLTDEPANAATGGSNTVVTNIHAVSTAPYNTPDTYNKVPVTFTLQLGDKASGDTGSVTFSGYFSGTTTGSSSNVYFTLTSPQTESVTLGGNTYTVGMGTYTPPGPPSASNAGSLSASVSVAPATGGGHTSGLPEPSTLVLAGLALPCLGWFQTRKRRANARGVAVS